jgi:uncharacterized protein RhaS with RHS repeats
LNRRYLKESSGSVVEVYAFDKSNRIIATLNSAGVITGRYIYGAKPNVPDYVVKSSTTYQIVSNHLGSPVQIINTSTDAVIQEIHYDVWGNIISDTNPGFTPFGFAGGQYNFNTQIVANTLPLN